MSIVDSFSIMLTPGVPQDTAELSTWLGAQSLSSRLGGNGPGAKALTPLVGYGVLQLDSSERIPWDSGFTELFRNNYQDDPDASKFLDSVIESRRGRDAFDQLSSGSAGLTAFRSDIFDVAFRATQAFVRSWDGELTSVSNWSKHSVAVEDDSRNVLVAALGRAVDSLASLTGPDKAAPLLGAEALRVRLEMIKAEVDADHALHGTVVEYCTQLFWHAMTFDAKVYPRYDELAVQVSLTLANPQPHPHRRRNPSSAVQRVDYDDLNECVAASIERGYRSDRIERSSRDEFFLALGRTLHATFDKYEGHAALGAVQRFVPREKQAHVHLAGKRHAIALTTNFDLELERGLALARPGASFHVAMPVYVDHVVDAVGIPANDRAVLRWIVGQFRSVEAHEDVVSKVDLAQPARDQPLGDWRWFRDLQPDELKGPLVIKLGGSPCHDLPSILSSSPMLSEVEDVRIMHATLLDEIDFIQAVNAEAGIFAKNEANTLGKVAQDQRETTPSSLFGLPAWVYSSLESTHRLWLMCGNRFADWTLRLHVFLHLSRLGPRGATQFVDVANDVPDDRAHLLRWLGVVPLRGDASDLIQPLSIAAERMAT